MGEGEHELRWRTDAHQVLTHAGFIANWIPYVEYEYELVVPSGFVGPGISLVSSYTLPGGGESAESALSISPYFGAEK